MAASVHAKSRGREVLNLVMAVLAVVLVFEIFYDWESAINAGGPEAGAAGGLQAGLAAADLENIDPDYDAYIEAPVFDQDRAPIRLSTPEVSTGTGATLDDLTLVGTLIRGNDRWAMFRVAGQSELIRARPGERVSDWTVKTIDPGLVVLEQPGRTEELGLSRDNGSRE